MEHLNEIVFGASRYKRRPCFLFMVQESISDSLYCIYLSERMHVYETREISADENQGRSRGTQRCIH